MVEADIGARIVARCRSLGARPFSESSDILFRPWLSDAFMNAQAQVDGWMREAGMQTRQDAAGNLVGRLEGATSDAPAVVFGSHIDTVPNGGCFDGLLGVVLGISVVEALSRAGQRLPFAIEVIAFGDEEGSAFPVSMITSRAVAGIVDPADFDLSGPSGTVTQTMRARGLDPAALGEAARAATEIVAFVEAHIEQGPVLEALDRPVAAVQAIAAQRRGTVQIRGVAGHAGTLPMAMRQDALAAAAEAILLIERVARDLPEAADSGLVATVGRMDVGPGATNVVPDAVSFSLDVRAGDRRMRDEAVKQIENGFAAIAQKRQVSIECTWLQDLKGAACDPALVSLMQEAAVEAGGTRTTLVSGAGHDTMVMAQRWPSVMLFVRSPGGISHHPDETVLESDVAIAHRALLGFVDRFAQCLKVSP
jgi:allantoate deiminase